MDALRPLPKELKLEAHLAELECAGFTLIPDAIPPALLKRLRLAHARTTATVRAARPASEWSWESDEPGVVDFFRAYEVDPVFEELLDLEAVFPVVDCAVREGRGREKHPGGARLLSGPVTQHLPAGSLTGQQWHIDGDYIRCTYVLNDLGADGGGTVFLPGSHHLDKDYGYLLNNQEHHTYAPPRENRPSPPFDRSPHQPHHIPGAYQLVASAGSCLVNWTTLWHTRTANTSTVDRDTIWQVFRRPNQPVSPRKQCSLSAAYLQGLRRRGNAVQRRLVDDVEAPSKWCFEGLSVEEQRRANAGLGLSTGIEIADAGSKL
jgi:hypothetical protein